MGHAVGEKSLDERGLRAPLCPSADEIVHLVDMGNPRLQILEAGIPFQVLAAHGLQQGVEVTVVVADDRDVPVACRIDVVGRFRQPPVPVAGAHGNLSAAAMVQGKVRA
jgi:hypothetical protein